jgi:hypothetical protein
LQDRDGGAVEASSTAEQGAFRCFSAKNPAKADQPLAARSLAGGGKSLAPSLLHSPDVDSTGAETAVADYNRSMAILGLMGGAEFVF